MRAAVVSLMVLSWCARDADAGDIVARPLVLESGAVEARFVIEAAIDSGRAFGRPLSLAPDLWWGLTRRLTLGLVHSSASLDRIDAGRTFCVRSGVVPGSTCDHAFRGSGLDARLSAIEGSVAIAPRIRLLVRDVDPWKPAITLGLLGRASHGRIAVTIDPYLRLGLANRDMGNRAALVIPLWLAVEPMRGTAVALHVGYEADVAVARDGWRMPLGIGVTRRLGRALELGFELGWPALWGPQHYLRRRDVMLAATWRR